MAENQEMVGVSLKDLGIDLSSIKQELRSEIHTYILKTFLAGVACVLVANFFYAAMKGK